MLKECTEGVEDSLRVGLILGPEYEIQKLQQKKFLDSNRRLLYHSSDGEGWGLCISQMKNTLLSAFRMRGVYDVRGNSMFLNEFYIDQPTKMIQVIRHEGWHAAQDYMPSTLDNTFTTLIHPEEAVPDWIRRGRENLSEKCFAF